MKSILKYTFVFLTAFALAGTIAFMSVKAFTKSAGEVVLPQLTGKNIIYVLETLTQMGLNAKLHGSEFDDSVPRYSVISQDPKPGTTIKKGRDVIIFISKGKKQTLLPDLRQVSLEQALILLEKSELTPGHISYTYSERTHESRVMEQYPAAFSSVYKGSKCNLLISRGPRPIGRQMPDLGGIKIESATRTISQFKLKIDKIVSGTNSAKKINTILSQTPAPGSFVTPATGVTLVVNGSKKNKTMDPNRLKQMHLIRYTLPSGILKSHVRIESDMYGPVLTLQEQHMKPGQEIRFLIPAGNKSQTNVFIDHNLIKTITIDPWEKDTFTGENLSWHLSPLQSYQPISQN